MLNAHGVRSSVCSMDNMRAIRIHHEPCFLREREGAPTDRTCIPVSNPPERVRALSRTFAHFHALSRIYDLIAYFAIHAACSIAH